MIVQISRPLEHLRKTGADVVMGSRLDGEIRPGAMPTLHQYVGYPLRTRFLNAFSGAGVSDVHSGFPIFTREAYETMELETTGVEFASEMITATGASDLEIGETPIVYHEREGEETLESFKDGWCHVRFMLVNASGDLFSLPGAVLGAFGVLVMALAATGTSISGPSFGIHSMIASSRFAIVDYEVVSLGVFATVAGEPIRKPQDWVTRWVTESLSLECATMVGLGMFAVRAASAGSLVYQ